MTPNKKVIANALEGVSVELKILFLRITHSIKCEINRSQKINVEK
jgi:hypothetical protein